MEWISVDKELPPPGLTVDISYGLVGIRAAVCDDWISEGHLTKGGIWSVKWIEGMPKHPKPTHWRSKVNL